MKKDKAHKAPETRPATEKQNRREPLGLAWPLLQYFFPILITKLSSSYIILKSNKRINITNFFIYMCMEIYIFTQNIYLMFAVCTQTERTIQPTYFFAIPFYYLPTLLMVVW